MSALSGFEEQIASLMPPHEAREYRAKLTAERAAYAQAEKTLHEEIAKAFIELAEAQLSSFPRAALTSALTHISKAMAAASVIDPEDA